MRTLNRNDKKEYARIIELITAASDQMQEALGTLETFIGDKVSEMDDWESERSEAWQNSDGVEEWQEWRDRWEEAQSEVEMVIDQELLATLIELPERVGE